MLRVALLLLSPLFSHSFAATIDVVGTPWWNPGEQAWFISKAPDRDTSLAYAIGLQQNKLGSLVYLDKLPQQNGSATHAALMSSEHVGIGQGFAAADSEPLTMTRLTQRIKENQQRNMVPVSICGYEETDGRILFAAIWMPSKTIEYQVQFDSQNQSMTGFQNQGYYAVAACSTKTFSDRTATPSVVVIWHRRRAQSPSSVRVEQKIVIDASDKDCSTTSMPNGRDQFYPISMQLFNKGNSVRCTAIWQKMAAPSLKYALKKGIAPVNVVNFSDKEMKPRQISIFRNSQGHEQLMVLWTNYETRNISFDGTFYSATDTIPINWLPGSTTGMNEQDKVLFEQTVTKLMRNNQIPSLTFALSRNDQLKRAVAFGYANPFAKEAATVTSKFRLGSVSKVITSAAIFTLIDQGLLSLNATVFGQGGILGTEYGTQPYSQNLLKVRLMHLLEHTSGAWGAATTSDILFAYEGFNQSAFLGIAIDKFGPVVEPGTVSDYANVGYYLLSVIITKVTGKPYEQYVKEKLWSPAGVPADRANIENRWFSDRHPNEAVFFPDAVQSITDSYDLIDAERVASAGGWIASPMDVLRVTRLFNGFNYTQDVLTSNSLTEMTRPSNASGGAYCRGIAVGTDFLGFWHNGYYPGGMAMYERHRNGIELMYMHNKGPDTLETFVAIQGAGRLFMELTPEWPQNDLFST